MSTNFRYATPQDLEQYFNRITDFDNKHQIFNPTSSGNLHTFHNSGDGDALFLNGEDLGDAEGSLPDDNGEWWYVDDDDKIQYYDSGYSSTTINEQIFELGENYSNFIGGLLINASLELHNYLDARYSTPLEKTKQVSLTSAANAISEEYDPIIIKAVCYIAAANAIRAKEGVSEEADYFHSLVTNADRTGILDKLNDGIYKLSFEVDANDKKGSIRYRAVSGTMDIVELSGEYQGESYDLLKVEIETSGVYGTGEYKVHYLSDDKLFGAVTSAEKITGGLQHIYGGLYGRFQGSSATDGDIWEIEVYGSHRKQTNKSSASIEMIR